MSRKLAGRQGDQVRSVADERGRLAGPVGIDGLGVANEDADDPGAARCAVGNQLGDPPPDRAVTDQAHAEISHSRLVLPLCATAYYDLAGQAWGQCAAGGIA